MMETVNSYLTTLNSGNVTFSQLQTMVSQMNTYRTSPEYENMFKAFNDAVGAYVASAGLNKDNNNTLKNNALSVYDQLIKFQTVYILINQKLIAMAKDSSTSASTGATAIGTLQDQIAKAKNDIKTLTNDLDTAKSRQSAVANSSTDVSEYQGFASNLGFTRPLRTLSVPILLASGLFLIFLVGLLFYDTFKPTGEGPSFGSLSDKLSDLRNSFSYDTSPKGVVLGLGIGLALFCVIFIPLAYYGYLGKR